MNKRTIIISVLSLSLILVAMNVYKYLYLSYDKYEILQQDMDDVDIATLDMTPFPLVMTYFEEDTLEYNVNSYNKHSPLSIERKFITKKIDNSNSEFVYHNYPLFYVKPSSDIDIIIIPQKENMTDISNCQQIVIKLHPHNILYIPRFCHWKMSKVDETENVQDTTIEIYHSHTPLSWILSQFNNCSYRD